jgi:hypothetical protein
VKLLGEFTGVVFDDKPTTDLSDISGATNFVNLALKQAMAGKQVETPATGPYGCWVKYSD